MRCKNCKEKFNQVRFNQKYCLKDECIKAFVQEAKDKEWKKRKAKLKNDLLTLSDYLKLAQQVFNKWIRQRDKGLNCISCNKKFTDNETVHASHYKPAGTCYNVRFNEDNVHVSCVKCNTWLHGNLVNYREKLINKIGEERVLKLESEANHTKKFTIEELKEIIETYKQKLKQ